MDVRSATSKINQHSILLVYPIQNRPQPASIWSVFFPRLKMRWEWDDESDSRVADIWHLKTKLSGSGRVVYAKWYQGRATFFSREVFPFVVAAIGRSTASLSPSARRVLAVLEEDSPLSTKALKERTGLRGKKHEREYEKALKELWSGLFLVGFGEVDDGAFPSLAIGATSLLFSDLWSQAEELRPEDARTELETRLGPESLFLTHVGKLRSQSAVRLPTTSPFLKTVRYEDLVKK